MTKTAAMSKEFAQALAMSPAELARETQKARRELYAHQRMLAAVEARDDILKLCEVTMPDFTRTEDPLATIYKVRPHHKVVADAFEKVLAGKLLKVIITIPPQFGKSALCKRLLAQHVGKFPFRHLIYATYNQTFAEENGGEVRDILQSDAYQLAYPKVKLAKGSKARDHMMIEGFGGKLAFAGRGGTVAGRPADGLIFDDFFKGHEEADSLTIRDAVWNFLTTVVLPRCHMHAWQIIVSCMTGDTPVLLPDGTERRLDSLRVGDEVATFDNGILSTAKVEAWKSSGRDSIFKITTSSGRVVRANGRHPFLVYDNGELKWVRTRNLTTASRIVAVPINGESGKVRNASSKGAATKQNAGVTVHRTTARKSGQTDIDPHRTIQNPDGPRESRAATASRLTNIIANLLSKARSALSAVLAPLLRVGARDFALTTATNQDAFAGFSAISATSQLGILDQSVLRSPLSNTSEFTTELVISVESDGEEEVFDVQINRTENFIANGFVSHNTRWSHDDPVARMIDPKNPYYREAVAKQWTVINIPAIVENEHMAKALGLKVGDALWADRFGLEHLATLKATNERGFSALFMGRPTPPEGDFFKRDQIHGYTIDELPENGTNYLAGDFAVSKTSTADSSCAGQWVDGPDDTLYLRPELLWDRVDSGQWVEWLIDSAKNRNALTLFAEKGVIDKAVGPFLAKRMREREKYFHVHALPSAGNKGACAAAIRDRMAMGKVKFPKFASWWPRAEEAILKFGEEGGPDDDFVDMLGCIGRGMTKQLVGRENDAPKNVVRPKSGTRAWFKWVREHEKRDEKKSKALAGW